MLDNVDIKILNMLQDNARIKRSTMAEAVGFSLPSLSERMKKLEESGVIEGYYAKLKKQRFHLDITVFISVIMDSSKSYSKLTEKVLERPEILECFSVLGEGSHLLKAVVKDTAALEKLLSLIQSWPGVNHTVTSFVLSAIKETTKLHI